jgi:hypothetical protein
MITSSCIIDEVTVILGCLCDLITQRYVLKIEAFEVAVTQL